MTGIRLCAKDGIHRTLTYLGCIYTLANVSERDGATGAVRSRLGAVTDCLRGSLPALRNPAGQGGRLPDPRRQLRLVELVVLVDVEVAHFLVLGLAGGTGRSDVLRKKATLT